MEEETKRAVEDAIIAGHLKLAHKIIKMATRDARPSPRTGRYTNAAYAIAGSAGFAEPRDEVQAFLCGEGFLWFLQLLNCEPGRLEEVAGRIVLQAFGP